MEALQCLYRGALISDPRAHLSRPEIQDYFQVGNPTAGLKLLIEGLETNELPPIPLICPKSATLALLFNPVLALPSEVDTDIDSRGPPIGFMLTLETLVFELPRGAIDSLRLVGWPSSGRSNGWRVSLESSDFVGISDGLAYLLVAWIRCVRLKCALDSRRVSRLAANESEMSELTDLAAEAAVGIDNLDAEAEAAGFIRLSVRGARLGGGPMSPVFGRDEEAPPIAEGEIGPFSLTVPRLNGLCPIRARAAFQSLPADTGGAVNNDPSETGARGFGGAIVGTTLKGAGAEVDTVEERFGNPNRDFEGTADFVFIGENVSTSSSLISSHSLEAESFPGEPSLLDPVRIVDMVFSSVMLLSDLNRIVLPAGLGRFPVGADFNADRLASSDFFPGVPGVFRRGEA